MRNSEVVWDDGRSGRVGVVAGNAALRYVTKSEEGLVKEKGTTFATSRGIYVGRVATENYLTAKTVHWANVSWDQHVELTRQARRQKKALHYLFVTAAAPADVRSWLVPGAVVERSIRRRGKDQTGSTMAIHIVADRDRFFIGEEDVTAYFSLVPLSPGESSVLARLLGETTSENGRSADEATNAAGEDAIPGRVLAEGEMTSFDIPVAGARTARLSVPLPLSSADISRIKGWVDLMTDVLVEHPQAARDRERSAQRDWLRSQLEEGVRQLDRGEGVDGEAAIARILAKSATGYADKK